ncbi:MAG: hypothetical protein HYT73_01710 [Candidatus Aenigmarchaeota archaeon]|nr:hypothetical protein [Candidatus Aenigmarchaeota archaeon]
MKTRGFQHPKGISDVMLWTMIGLALALIALAILASIAGSQTTLVKNDIEIQRESVYTMPVYGPCHDYEEADFSWKVLR